MITLAGSVDATAIAAQGLRQATENAGRSIVALASGEVPPPTAAEVSGGAVSPTDDRDSDDKTVGTRLNTVA